MKKRRKKELEQKKKVLKEDVFVESVTRAWEKVGNLRVYLIVGAAAILAAVIVAGFALEGKQVEKDRGWQALSQLEEKIANMEDATEEEVDSARLAGLEELARQPSAAQPMAAFYYADALFQKGGDENLKKAEAQCRFFLDKFPDNYYALAVRQFLGKVLFEQKKYTDALDAFRGVFRAEPSVMRSLTYEAQYYIGRCQELQGRVEQARSTYEALAAESTESPLWAQMARFRLSKMQS